MKSIKESKKSILLIALAALVFMLGITNSSAHEIVNYNGIHMTVDEYMTLLNLGFTENQIYYMDEETYELNKDLDATLLGQTTKYYKTVYPTYGTSYTVEVTEEEYNNAGNEVLLPTGIVETTYKTIVSSIAQNGSKYRYTVSTLWKIMPSTRSYDIIGIGFSDPVYISSSVYFSFTYANSAGAYTTSTQYYNKKSLSTGGAAVYKLPSGTIKSLSATLYFDVSKSTSNTITTLGICGDYAHATSSVPAANISDYSIGISGINLGTSITSYYDATPCAMQYTNVSW